MSDNEFNNNHNEEKDPWDRPDNRSESAGTDAEKDVSQETSPQDAPAQDTPAQETPEWKDDSSSKPEEPKQSPYQQPGQYQNPQNPYSPYGQNNNTYGQYNNPYGNYNNPYKGYGQNNYNPYGQQNNQPPYWSYQYQNPAPRQPMPPKRKNTGLKVFLWILGILAAGTLTAFLGFAVYTASEGDTNVTSSQTEQQEETTSSAVSGSQSSQAQIEGKIAGDGTNKNSSGIVINATPSGTPMSAKQVYKNVVESVVGVETEIGNVSTGESGESQGTGIVATSDGYILTNAHVVNNSRANKVTVILHNSKEYAATVVGYDKTSDLAVLRINATNLTPAVFGNADQLEVGDQVIAIGNPGGMSFASSLTGGLVSALNRTIESHSDNGMTYIQTDAAINPGNSGGPLVNMYGQVVGINSNKIVATGYEGMGFSIPVSKAKTIIDQLIAHGYVTGRSRLGITAVTITEVQAQLTGYPVGVMIREISSESDLAKSKVNAGDIITKADGTKITSLDDLYPVLNKHKAGDTITLTIYSPGSSQTSSGTRDVKTKLLEDKGETQAK